MSKTTKMKSDQSMPEIKRKKIDVDKVVKLAKKVEKSWRKQEEYLQKKRERDEYQAWARFL